MVRRLVEQQQVRVGDHEPGQRGARLLAARHRRRRLRPLVPREPEAAQRRVDALVERVAAEDLVLVLEVRVARLGRRGRRARTRRAPRPSGRGAPRRSGPPSGGRATAMNASSKCASWREQPDRQAALARDLAAVGLVAARDRAAAAWSCPRRSARRGRCGRRARSPRRSRRGSRTSRPRGSRRVEPEDATSAGLRRPRGRSRPRARRAAARRRRGRLLGPLGQLRPARPGRGAGRRSCPRRIAAAPARSRLRQPLAPRAEVGAPRRRSRSA